MTRLKISMETTVFEFLRIFLPAFTGLSVFSYLWLVLSTKVSCEFDGSWLRFCEWNILHKRKSKSEDSDVVKLSDEYAVLKDNVDTARKYYRESLRKCQMAKTRLEEKGKLKIYETDLSAEIKRLRLLGEQLELIEHHVRAMEPVIASNLKYDKYYQDVLLEEKYKGK